MFGGVGTVGEDTVDHQEHQAKRQRERRLVFFNGEGRKRRPPVAVEAAVRGLAIAERIRVSTEARARAAEARGNDAQSPVEIGAQGIRFKRRPLDYPSPRRGHTGRHC